MNEILDLEAIKARCEAALASCPGPWRAERYDEFDDGWEVEPVAPGQECGIFTQAEAEFVAHAQEDIPRLIAEIERLRTLIPDPMVLLRLASYALVAREAEVAVTRRHGWDYQYNEDTKVARDLAGRILEVCEEGKNVRKQT